MPPPVPNEAVYFILYLLSAPNLVICHDRSSSVLAFVARRLPVLLFRLLSARHCSLFISFSGTVCVFLYFTDPFATSCPTRISLYFSDPFVKYFIFLTMLCIIFLYFVLPLFRSDCFVLSAAHLLACLCCCLLPPFRPSVCTAYLRRFSRKKKTF